MTKKFLDLERQQMFSEYMLILHQTTMSFEKRGRYADAVLLFLQEADSVSRSGYRHYSQSHAELMVQKTWMKSAILHFLSSRGIGYKKTPNSFRIGEIDSQPLEKHEVRQKRIVNDFLFWLQNEKDFSEHTLKVYADTVKQYFSYFDVFNLDNAKRFISMLEEKGYKPKTICLRITGLEKFAEHTKKPIKIKRPKIHKSLSVENVPSEKEYHKLLEWLDMNNPKWAYIVRLMGTTGCRVSELIQFTFEQIQQGHCLLKGKGSKYRQFFFTKEMQELARGKTGTVATNRFGRAISTRGITANLYNFAQKAGIPKEKVHPHAFRHFFAKMYLKKTKDVVALADILGHSSIDTTRVYLQKTHEEQKRQFNRNVTW